MEYGYLNVMVRFLGTFAERFGDQLVVELRGPATVKDILDVLGISESAVSLTIVNGTQVPFTAQLCDGASVLLVPPVIGG
ncbi:MAG TPA: MoaD/ThiS family protein [Firmicutes bacterium]|nr:MoaD/ThiS family protein [Candidatus Fermentithermobacillaceae bacterium]